jgi:putative SOS response-associated peptidase YedK
MKRGQFRAHLKERRCVIPAQGFTNGGRKAANSPIISQGLTERT